MLQVDKYWQGGLHSVQQEPVKAISGICSSCCEQSLTAGCGDNSFVGNTTPTVQHHYQSISIMHSLILSFPFSGTVDKHERIQQGAIKMCRRHKSWQQVKSKMNHNLTMENCFTYITSFDCCCFLVLQYYKCYISEFGKDEIRYKLLPGIFH